MRHRGLFASLLLSTLLASLAACSSGVTPVAPPLQATDAERGATTGTTAVNVVIDWRSNASRKARGPQFTSPSAQSVRLDVSSHDEPSVIAVTKVVNKPAHTSASTVRVEVPAGDDSFAFTVFDGRDAVGNELGGATVVKTIRAGSSNVVRAIFAGYAATFTIVPSDDRLAPIFENASQPLPTYTVAGEATLTFGVSVEDSDGNVILAPGVPTVKAISDDPSIFRVEAVNGHRNAFTIQAIAPIAGHPVHLVVEAQGAEGTTATASYALAQTPLMYISAGSGSSAHIYSVDTLDRNYPLLGGFPGLSRPVGLAIDSVKGRLYVADAGAAKILAYDLNGKPISGWSDPSVPGINAIAFSPHSGYVYATTSAGNGAVDVFSSEGAQVTLPNAFQLHATPVGIAYDPAMKAIGVVETGTPGYADIYSDKGTWLPNDSQSLTDVWGLPFTPVGIADGFGPSYAPFFWISGEDSFSVQGTTVTPTVAAYGLYGESWSFEAGFSGGQYPSVTSVMQGITAPHNAVVNPAQQGIFYIMEDSGPLFGFICETNGANPASPVGSWCGISLGFPDAMPPGPPPTGLSTPLTTGIIGYTGTIRRPGVKNFTAAVFSQY